MPVQIGATAHNFTDPAGLLSDCHRWVEMFLDILTAVADRNDQPATDDTRSALAKALRYFREAAPRHTEDEEASLFPRLRKINHPDIRSAFSQLDKLEAEHRWAEPIHAEVDRLGVHYLETGELSDAEVKAFRDSICKSCTDVQGAHQGRRRDGLPSRGTILVWQGEIRDSQQK